MLEASIAIILGLQFTSGILGYYSISVATFIGAISTTIVVFRFSKSNKTTNVATMLLGGIAFLNQLIQNGLYFYTQILFDQYH